MASPDPLISSVGGLGFGSIVIDPLGCSHHSTPLINQGSGLSSPTSPDWLSIKEEPVPQSNDFSQDEVDEMIKRSWEIKAQHMLRRDQSIALVPTSEAVPLARSLYGLVDLSITQAVKPNDDAIHDIKAQKVQSEQDFTSTPKAHSSELKEIKSVITSRPELGICAVEKLRSNSTSPMVNERQGKKNCDPRSPEKRRIQAKIFYAQVYLNRNAGRMGNWPLMNLSQPFSAHMQQTSHYLKRLLRLYPGRALFINSASGQITDRAEVPRSLEPQPPEDTPASLPNHQNAPQLSRLYKSFLGLAQCRSSEPEPSESSPHPPDLAGYTTNQGQPSELQVPNASMEGSGLGNASGHPSNPGIPGSTNNQLTLEQLHRQMYYDAGRTQGYREAIEELVAADLGAPEDYVPNVLAPSPIAHVPLPTHLNEHSIYHHSPDAHFLPESSFRLQYQHYRYESGQANLNLGFPPLNQLHQASMIPINPHLEAVESTVDSLDDYGRSLSESVNLHQHGAMPYLFDSTPASILNVTQNSSQHPQLSQASSLSPEASTSVAVGPAPSSNSKTCHECDKEFRRPADLMDHMHKHTGIKRHVCPFCQGRFAYKANLTNHKNKCKAKIAGHE